MRVLLQVATQQGGIGHTPYVPHSTSVAIPGVLARSLCAVPNSQGFIFTQLVMDQDVDGITHVLMQLRDTVTLIVLMLLNLAICDVGLGTQVGGVGPVRHQRGQVEGSTGSVGVHGQGDALVELLVVPDHNTLEVVLRRPILDFEHDVLVWARRGGSYLLGVHSFVLPVVLKEGILRHLHSLPSAAAEHLQRGLPVLFLPELGLLLPSLSSIVLFHVLPSLLATATTPLLRRVLGFLLGIVVPVFSVLLCYAPHHSRRP
mmetsp:Transcript_12513/g.33092  ORF Transcript_12513/g.33092 Transcript_12513/m.33092 type:complete len:259 (+) Transcript_12513:673-1449(+)